MKYLRSVKENLIYCQHRGISFYITGYQNETQLSLQQSVSKRFKAFDSFEIQHIKRFLYRMQHMITIDYVAIDFVLYFAILK